LKSWEDFNAEDSDMAKTGENLLLKDHPNVGYAFLATVRKDGAPRLHPISIVLFNGHLYVLIPTKSPKCHDLKRDGRYALQAFPPENNINNEEFYIAGRAKCIQDISIRQKLINDTRVIVEENEVLFELLLDRVMHTKLVNRNTPDEYPLHRKWRASS